MSRDQKNASPTDIMAESHRILGDGKTFDKQQIESINPRIVRGYNQERIWQKRERGMQPHIQ